MKKEIYIPGYDFDNDEIIIEDGFGKEIQRLQLDEVVDFWVKHHGLKTQKKKKS